MPGVMHEGAQASCTADINDGLLMGMGLQSQPLPGMCSTDVAERTFRSPISRGSWTPSARRSASATCCASAAGGTPGAAAPLLGTRLASAACTKPAFVD